MFLSLWHAYYYIMLQVLTGISRYSKKKLLSSIWTEKNTHAHCSQAWKNDARVHPHTPCIRTSNLQQRLHLDIHVYQEHQVFNQILQTLHRWRCDTTFLKIKLMDNCPDRDRAQFLHHYKLKRMALALHTTNMSANSQIFATAIRFNLIQVLCQKSQTTFVYLKLTDQPFTPCLGQCSDSMFNTCSRLFFLIILLFIL